MNYLHSMTEWRENYADILFQDTIRLSTIIPKVGSKLGVKIYKDEYPVIGNATLLWCPPASEVNGWDCHPSEIHESYLICGELKNPTDNNFQCVIKTVTPFIEAFELENESNEFQFPRCGQMDGSSYNLWERAKSLQVKVIGSYIYLSGVEGETSLEVILEQKKSKMYLLYHAYIPPATTESIITRYLLSDQEKKLFELLLEQAIPITEGGKKYLEIS